MNSRSRVARYLAAAVTLVIWVPESYGTAEVSPAHRTRQDRGENTRSTGAPLSPVLTNVMPSRLVLGEPEHELRLYGRNFTSGSAVFVFRFARDTPQGEVPTQFVGSGELRAVVPGRWLPFRGTYDVEIRDGGLTSNNLAMKCISPGTPAGPVLSEVSPSTVVPGSVENGLWMTFRGSGFGGDTLVFSPEAGDAFLTVFVSPNELRALVPSTYFYKPRVLPFWVESDANRDVGSELGVVEVVEPPPSR